MGRFGVYLVYPNQTVLYILKPKRVGSKYPTIEQGGRGYMSTHIIYLNYIKTSHQKETIYPIFILYPQIIWSNLRTSSGYIIHEQRI